MDPEDAIYTALVGTPAIAALLGTKVYKTYVENPVAPYIILQRDAEIPHALHREASEIEEVMIQVSCFETTHAKARALVVLVKAALDGQLLSNGDRPTLTGGGTSYDEVVGLYRTDADFIV